MAISTKKKNIIIAEWKTGIYKSKTALAKEYKLDPKTVTRILTGISQDNTDIVEVGVIAENAKKSLKNPIELRAVEKAVKTLTESEALINNLTVQALQGIQEVLKDKKVKKPIKMKNGDFDIIEQVDHDLTPIDFKNCIDGIDKASVTLGVNERFSSSQVQVNNQNNNMQEIKRVVIKRRSEA